MAITGKFYVKSISFSRVAGITTVTALTDVACHLWLRWTNIRPQKHIVPVLRRGTAFRSEVRLCFVAYHLTEQDEAGDVLIHTFTLPEWITGTTYYMYFFGSLSGTQSASTSPIFDHNPAQPPFGPPQTLEFTPDPGGGLITVDGYSQYWLPGDTFQNVRTGAASTAWNFTAEIGTRIATHSTPGFWYNWMRGLFTFPTTPIPAGSQIVSAKLNLYYCSVNIALSVGSSFTIVATNPVFDNDVVFADYNRFDTEPLSTPQFWSATTGRFNTEWEFNEAGLAAINPGGITRLGVREYNHDCLNIPPPWTSRKANQFVFRSADQDTYIHPTLSVTFRPPG